MTPVSSVPQRRTVRGRILEEGEMGDWREARTLEELYQAIKDCTRCELARTRTHLVFGVGDPRAEIMFVGEAPGYHEDRQGLPFVGPAGQFLDQLLRSIGLSRDQVYIANTLKCRPPDNRDPLPGELETCTPYLFKQIELINPRIICTLGNHATRTLLRTSTGITQLHGKVIRKDSLVCVPLFHPAAALHKPPLKAVLVDDFLKLGKYLEEERKRWEVMSREPAKVETEPEQMGLF